MRTWGQAIGAMGLGLGLGLATLTSLAPQAFASDSSFFPDDPTPQIPVEFGTGWYIRGDVAYAKQAKMPTLEGLSTTLNSGRENSLSFGLGFGYKFNNWIRADLVADYRKPNRSNDIGASLLHQTDANGNSIDCITQDYESDGIETAPPARGGCSPHYSSSVRQWDVLQNVYIDLGSWYGFTPYIGAGFGMSLTRSTSSVKWFQANGQPYQVTTSSGFYYDWDYQTSTMSYQFAWAAMAGAAYQLSDSAFIDFGYRYLNLGKYSVTNSAGFTTSKKDDIHEFRIGVRYLVDGML